jgi:hypothetical protein
VRGPDFIVIGAMKCATSTLHEQLAAQVGVFMTTPKEPCFFSDEEAWSRGPAWYEGLFAAARPEELRGESSTHYTKLPTHPETVPRMRRLLGDDVRFVYVMRHPVDRLVSHYIHAWTTRATDLPIDEAVEAVPELVAYGCYAMQLRPFLEAFGPDRVLPVFFDALRRHPQAQLERVFRFLGRSEHPVWTEDRGRQNVSEQRLRASPLRDWLRDLPGATTLRRAMLPRSLRDRIKRRWQMTERPAPSPPVRARLEARFDEDLATLGTWLGIELACARFAETTGEAEPSWRDGLSITPGCEVAWNR